MTVYISGPITNMIDLNRNSFEVASALIYDLKKHKNLHDLKVINPLHIGARLDKRFALLGKEPQWADYMKACIKKLVDADCVFFLAHWSKSEGATMEFQIAKQLGIPCVSDLKGLNKILEGEKCKLSM